MAYKKVERIIYMDDEEYAWCSYGQEYKPVEYFNTNKNAPHGYAYMCKDCYKKFSMDCVNGKSKKTEEVKRQARLILENMGYDYNSDYSVHEQFLIRHNLTPKKVRNISS